jgi:hypothetical protein
MRTTHNALRVWGKSQKNVVDITGLMRRCLKSGSPVCKSWVQLRAEVPGVASHAVVHTARKPRGHEEHRHVLRAEYGFVLSETRAAELCSTFRVYHYGRLKLIHSENKCGRSCFSPLFFIFKIWDNLVASAARLGDWEVFSLIRKPIRQHSFTCEIMLTR